MVKTKGRKRPFLAVIFIFFLFLAGYLLLPDRIADDPSLPNQNGDSPESPSPTQPEIVDITIASVGDILIHNTLYFAAYDPATGNYDFKSQFQYVKPYLEQADITVANLETVLAGPEKGYASYPRFNTPDSIVTALKDAGVDILTAANNHRMDQGISGFYRTIEVVRNEGLDIIGVKAEEKEKTYVIKDIKGVKIAFLNYGYTYPRWDGSLDVNGLILPAEMAGLLASFDPQDVEKSLLSIEESIKDARADGAEIIILFLHWGDEYHRQPNNFQKELASKLVSLGVDAIFGGHPHVLQPAVYLTSPAGSKVPVFYSLGNFISDQRLETVDDIYTEQGLIAKITFRIKVGPEDTLQQPENRHELSPRVDSLQPERDTKFYSRILSKEVIEAQGLPTWVNKKIRGNRFFYEVIPAEEALDTPDKFPMLVEKDLERIRFCRDTVKQITSGLTNSH
ncbi:MAG TPA: CapA family protein [Peptococcaceae bacterium]|nr:CapA family protein [Peptococcaceae bacterium]